MYGEGRKMQITKNQSDINTLGDSRTDSKDQFEDILKTGNV